MQSQLLTGTKVVGFFLREFVDWGELKKTRRKGERVHAGGLAKAKRSEGESAPAQSAWRKATKTGVEASSLRMGAFGTNG